MIWNRVVILVPVILSTAIISGFFIYDNHWYKDTFLIIINGLFLTGQFIATVQYYRIFKNNKEMVASLASVAGLKNLDDFTLVEKQVAENFMPGLEKELILHWLELGRKGDFKGSGKLLENVFNRISKKNKTSLNFHNLINRLTLKMGFLGTLIGLVRTFPPMKKAILGLTEIDGEMSFVKNIAGAIDGDEYAIFTTLVATALSIIVESLSIFVLDKFMTTSESNLDFIYDWYILKITPVIEKKYAAGGIQNKLLRDYAETEQALVKTQAGLQNHIVALSKKSKEFQETVNEMNEAQNNINWNITLLRKNQEILIPNTNNKGEL